MRRVAIVGCAGAGKSTLAITIARALELPVVHLDRVFWKPGWVETSRDEFRAAQDAALPADGAWIADGNYSGTLALRVARADTIVFLDLPTHVCLYRVLRRRVAFLGRTRPDMGDGCQERLLDPTLPTFLRYVARFRAVHRPRVVAELATMQPTQRLVTLTTAAEVRRFVDGVSRS